MSVSGFSFALPEWVASFVAQRAECSTPEEKMAFVVSLSEANVAQGTGGPFAAAIFDSDTHELIAPGINIVVPAHCSVLHAEMVAIMMAQHRLGTHDLGAEGTPRCELVSSTEPCAMCMGAIPWSGVRRLICGASGEDACAIGMDEGAKPANWVQELAHRGIEVLPNVMRDTAAAVLRQYAAAGGPIYNGRS